MDSSRETRLHSKDLRVGWGQRLVQLVQDHRPGCGGHAFHLSPAEPEAGGWLSSRDARPHGEILSRNKQRKSLGSQKEAWGKV